LWQKLKNLNSRRDTLQLDKSKKFFDATKILIESLELNKDLKTNSDKLAEYLLNTLYAMEIFIKNNTGNFNNFGY